MQKLQEVLVNRLSENMTSDYLQTGNEEFLDMFLTAKHFLLSTEIRVSELVRQNIEDIDFSERECVVYGKVDKERKAYFDAKTKVHLLNYINGEKLGVEKKYIRINSEGLRLPEQLKRECQSAGTKIYFID